MRGTYQFPAAPQAAHWPWSSAAAHLGLAPADPLPSAAPVAALIDREPLFDLDLQAQGLGRLRAASISGRPLGSAARVKSLEAVYGRPFTPRPTGRPKKAASPTAGHP